MIIERNKKMKVLATKENKAAKRREQVEQTKRTIRVNKKKKGRREGKKSKMIENREELGEERSRQ